MPVFLSEASLQLKDVGCRLVTEDFKNALGKFTPCFADIIILGESLFRSIMNLSIVV